MTQPLRLLAISMIALFAASCANRPKPLVASADASPAMPPATVRLTARPAAAGDQGTVTLRVRELQTDALPTTQPVNRPARVPAGAKLIKTVDVIVPVGPNFSAGTQLGKTDLQVAGAVERWQPTEYRTRIRYSETTPFDRPGPGQPVSIRSIQGTYPMNAGDEVVIGGLLGDHGASILTVSILLPQWQPPGAASTEPATVTGMAGFERQP